MLFGPRAWRYRDYVVRAFNTDKPYDRFLTEQLAGDELDPDDPELRVAVGYLRLGAYEYNQRNVHGQWADILNDITDVTGEVFLGLSIGCARCHDHKFDPILQEDYYRLQAFFTPLLPRDDLTIARPGRMDSLSSQAGCLGESRGGSASLRLPRSSNRIATRVPARRWPSFPRTFRPFCASQSRTGRCYEKQIGALAFRQIAFEHGQVPAQIKGPDKARWDKLQKELKTFDELRPVAPSPVLTATDVGPVSPPTLIPGDRTEAIDRTGIPVGAWRESMRGSGRARRLMERRGGRLALARWLSRSDNPLSTRVIVNRIWQYHFGRGLVGTPSDFGRLGEPPSHPELLDWLAKELVRQGWRLKPLHRLILTSAAYRQSAIRSPGEVAAARRVDPENRLLWKRTVGRLGAEEIRDAMLASSGELATSIGGPSMSGEASPADDRYADHPQLARGASGCL